MYPMLHYLPTCAELLTHIETSLSIVQHSPPWLEYKKNLIIREYSLIIIIE